METIPTTSRSLDRYYHINGDTFEKQYKEVLSGYKDWDQLGHAGSWLLFPENIGVSLAIDETSLSNGELYTIVTNRDKHGKSGCLVAVIEGTKAEDVWKVLDKILKFPTCKQFVPKALKTRGKKKECPKVFVSL